MRILCLCPTYGRPKLVANAIAMLLAQDHPAADRKLLVLDDAGQLPSGHYGEYAIVSTPERFPSLAHKYPAMLAAEGWPNRFEWDAVAIMDDDDLYGPHWLSSHARALQGASWSHPRQVWSLHKPPAKSPTEPGLEPSAGRFWGASAIRADLLRAVGGFVENSSIAYDQDNLNRWRRAAGNPARPDDFATPQYVYGWGRSNHCSLHAGSGDWYARHQQMQAETVENLTPEMDQQTRAIWPLLA